MTTIAYKDGVIAYDSRTTRGTVISDDDCEKLKVVKGVGFICTGAVCDYDALIAAYFGTPASSQVEASGYAVADGELWLVGHDDNTGIWKTRIDLRRADAIGSGSPFALTAMDMGASVEDAIRAAIKRDIYTGGAIRTLRVY
ncbi:proteasome subunit beta [Pseudomonas alkylphenolica]|uniref:Proteasome subunit beta n=1 Tax=Pseudomonas alkylphenolica TaxID=237609 RepID=A0A443ZQE0_9PSED|nr:proteasome subunit beta [Pseudomonas alkylphenolica]RWU21302.1 proteasome subunit beta [Pseudomonas alkylphenolica]